MPELSVIICTHNPQADYLRRVLDALKAQTLPKEQWELLLIDNASREPLASIWNLSWHPHARHIREDELGLTPARLRGIRESTGELLVFVDDDNVLRPDFLANAVAISREFPFLGAWGGNVEGEFEQEVPHWLKPHLHALAVREVDRDYWSNYYADNRSMPFGAGLCARKLVAVAYARAIISRPASRHLGRKGSSLVSGEDIDLALTAHDSGFGTGLFHKLRTTHIIPKGRMTVDYLCRLLEGIEYSTHLLRKQRDSSYAPPQDPTLTRWLKAYQVWRLPDPIRSIARAQNRGLAKATAEITSGS
jgi:glycosyltransferase involved in cell wall biosynthesis